MMVFVKLYDFESAEVMIVNFLKVVIDEGISRPLFTHSTINCQCKCDILLVKWSFQCV